MLSNVRILEFEALGPAPFAAMHLADLGAEVVTIHRPGSTPLGLLDRGKRSIALDLKAPDDLALAKALICRSDALIEGLRPGVMERLGLGPKEAQALNPKLVYGRMTGWGQSGPRARQAGHDLHYLGVSGALFYGGLPGETPGVPPTLLGDIGGGAMYLTIGILSALWRARETGQGAVVDAAIVDGASHMMALLASMGPQFARDTRGASLLDGPHWSRCYRCKDGRFLAVQCLEPKFYALFLQQMGLDNDPLFEVQFESTLWPRQTERLADIFASAPRADWLVRFEGSDACVAPVLSPDEAARDPHIAARGIWQGEDPAPAPRFDGQTARPGPVPTRDQDRAHLIASLTEEGLL